MASRHVRPCVIRVVGDAPFKKVSMRPGHGLRQLERLGAALRAISTMNISGPARLLNCRILINAPKQNVYMRCGKTNLPQVNFAVQRTFSQTPWRSASAAQEA
jgi:hypothetical protein